MSLSLSELLNPSDADEQHVQAHTDLVDIQPQLGRLAALNVAGTRATAAVQQKLLSVIEYLEAQQASSNSQGARWPSLHNPRSVTEEYNVPLNRRTCLSVLYHHPLRHVLEYPDTSSDGTVGHLFRMDPDDWQVPDLNIVYSRGAPMGRTLVGKEVFVDILGDAEGNMVACTESHSTCQGVKVCPYSDIDTLSQPHTQASKEDVQARLKQDREDRLQYASPSKEIFCRTAAYLTALRKLGCCRPLVQETELSIDLEERKQTRDIYLQQIQRGYRPKDASCEGRLLFGYNSQGQAYINRDHFYDFNVGAATGSYDLRYIKAILNEDEDEVKQIEDAAFALGYGPLVECTTVTNVTSQRAFCPFDHRNETDELVQPLMERLKCEVKFRVFEPLEEFRSECPYVLITPSGAHTHPIPLPTKTPSTIRTQVFQLLEELSEDLPDITPRRFLRHPIVRSFLAGRFPHIPTYIKQIKELHCPFGTGWEAIEHLKALQDRDLPPSEHYIRRIITLDADSVDQHDEDEDDQPFKDSKIRIIVCMSPKASKRLLASGRYLQTDIAFKRIVDFLEFEMACMERDANTSLIFCGVFLNRQSAVVHQQVFAAIDEIFYEDTGSHLKWRHLHAATLDDYEDMVLEWAADQHRGQAKGLGLYLQALASHMPLKADMHQPERSIQSLLPYKHLHRIFRLCSNHYYRNITSSSVSDEVKRLMRSLLCMEHENWEGTVAAIEEKGGKVGKDWLKDKESTHFAFQAICWEKSFIPKHIWMSGDSNTNLIESVHLDVNREGVHCTLLGGLQKGQAYDSLKMHTLEVGFFLLSLPG
ncbi:hypothetical protein C8R44DRAFT_622063 [Mycena epipterygia]|nr:hypothetical protein C8R44DRAFT_622063 [Mycena epipterygia]